MMMKPKSSKNHKRHWIIEAVFVAVAVGFTMANSVGGAHAASNDTLYLSPSSGSYTVDSDFSVAIRENSYADQVNAVEADLSFDATYLQFVSTSLTGTAFGVTAVNSSTASTVSIQLGNTSPVTGDNLVATVTFKVLAAGNTGISFASSSQVLASIGNANVVGSMTGGSYTLAAAQSSGGSGSGGSGNVSSTPPPKTTAPPTTSPKPTQSIATTITPTNNPTPVPVPSDSSAELSQNATVNTTPTTPVTKVQYYLNNKLVATESAPPYEYSVKVTSLRNGKYTLTTKTYYQDGTINAKNTALIVKNPFGWNQVKLQLQHYIIFIVPTVAILAGVAWYSIRRRIDRWTNPHSPMPTSPAGPTTPDSSMIVGSGS